MNKPYLLFAGTSYYPKGGGEDFISAHATEEEARSAVPRLTGESLGYSDDVDWAKVAHFDGEHLRTIAWADVPLTHRAGGPLKWRTGDWG